MGVISSDGWRYDGHLGDRVLVGLTRPTGIRRAIDMSRLRANVTTTELCHPGRLSFYDLGTYYQVDGNNSSGYRESASEMSVAPTAQDYAALRDRWIANYTAGVVTVGGSGRRIETSMRLQSNSDETDGCIITAMLKSQGGASRAYNLIAAGDVWTEQVPQALRLSALAALPAGPSSAHVSSVADGIAGESRESWDAESRSRTGKDGTIVARVLDGRWTLSVTSVRQFYSFDTGDLVNYKLTEEPAFERPEATVQAVEFGVTQSTTVDVWLVPQLHQWRLDWTARYLFISIYGNFEVVEYPNTGLYLSRLPFYPVRYSMTLVGSAVQAASISSQVSRTQTYATMLVADTSRQIITPFMIMLLDARVDGQWRLYQREVRVGQLVAVLRYRYQGGPPIVRYVWRRTLDHRAFTLLDSGALNVPGEVSGII